MTTKGILTQSIRNSTKLQTEVKINEKNKLKKETEQIAWCIFLFLNTNAWTKGVFALNNPPFEEFLGIFCCRIAIGEKKKFIIHFLKSGCKLPQILQAESWNVYTYTKWRESGEEESVRYNAFFCGNEKKEISRNLKLQYVYFNLKSINVLIEKFSCIPLHHWPVVKLRYLSWC